MRWDAAAPKPMIGGATLAICEVAHVDHAATSAMEVEYTASGWSLPALFQSFSTTSSDSRYCRKADGSCRARALRRREFPAAPVRGSLVGCRMAATATRSLQTKGADPHCGAQ